MLELGIKALLAYMLGSVNGALVVGRLYGGVDIRKSGSGNAGGTNALRSQGPIFALFTVCIDIGKGFLPVWILPGMALPLLAGSQQPDVLFGPALYAAAAVLGHCYPLWHGFRGGKGAATMVGAYLALAPILLVPVLLGWLVALLLFGYVGIATMISGLSAPIYILLKGLNDSQLPVFYFSSACALFLVYTHRSNIQRLLAGTENCMFPRALLRRKR
ncbi:MAG: glycerol-3-phosphate 1-O-acyltransferase PlsY [Gammaproteobacteria bacterium]|jgi:glycerol-3-phosphate acyltransferase PlsY|nr:glycerol-3-phosphate 1-O-acyltransferase PlsY [Gammaproteobacteria bacterium]